MPLENWPQIPADKNHFAWTRMQNREKLMKPKYQYSVLPTMLIKIK